MLSAGILYDIPIPMLFIARFKSLGPCFIRKHRQCRSKYSILNKRLMLDIINSGSIQTAGEKNQS